jgi:hypothetical protein
MPQGLPEELVMLVAHYKHYFIVRVPGDKPKCLKVSTNTYHLRNPKRHELVLRSRCNNDYLSGILRVFE